MRNSILILLIVVIACNSCKKSETTCIDGNGDIIQEQREVDPFNKVFIIGDFTTSIDQGQISTVDFFAESNIIPIIRTDVNNQQLQIIVQGGNCYNTIQPVEVYISSPDYIEINVDGSGDISANNLNLDKLTLNIDGSGKVNSILGLQHLDLNLTGSGDANIVGDVIRGEFSLSGSGNIYSSNFSQDTVYVKVSGSGDVHIKVSAFLDVTITGSGSVYYKGNPSTINQNITGSGKLIDEG